METTMDSKPKSFLGKSSQKEEPRITKDMTIGEVVALYPQVVPIMLENGIHCFGCHVAHWETLEQGFKGHYGMDEEKLEMFIEQLNMAVEQMPVHNHPMEEMK